MAIHFYRAFAAPIKVLSFDLDDTLYFNDDVIQRAEEAQFEVITQALPEFKKAGLAPWLTLKWQVLKQDPSLKHDVTAWRKAVIKAGLKPALATMPNSDWEALVEQAFTAFYHARSDFEIEPQVHDILSKLSKRWPLIAVTNGNVNIERIDLAQHFVGYYRAGERNNRMKPWPDMLNMAADELDIAPKHILHIGDNLGTDILAASRAGCSSLWFNPSKQPPASKANLANAEYSDLADLLTLL